MYMLASESYLDKINKTYKKIITISQKPTGTLATIVKQIRPERLSTYSVKPLSCIFALKSLNNLNELMEPDEIPQLFCYLTENGYTIDTAMTTMMNESNIYFENKTLICFIKPI